MISIKQTFSFRSPQHSGSMLTLTHYVVSGILALTKSKFLSVKKMSPSLASEMKPIVDDSLNDVGAIKAYDDTMAAYTSVPFVPDIKSDMSGYVVEKGIEGIFHYMAEEEAAIRNNPAKRTTELLERVFGL